jgi:hypothetical protein
MKKTGKLVGVCNCKCHCDLKECFTEHDNKCSHCKKMKTNIEIPIINNEYKVLVSWGSLEDSKRFMKGWGHTVLHSQERLDGFRGNTYYDAQCHPVIVLPHFPVTPAEVGTLAHEAVHAVLNVFDKLDERSYDEVFAHSVAGQAVLCQD